MDVVMHTSQPIALGFALFLFACGKGQPSTSPHEMASSTDGGAGWMGQSTIADNAGAPTEAQPALSDDEILGVLHAADAGEIDQGKLAQTKAKDARVKKLAAMMIKDHSDAETKGTSLAKRANLKLESSPTSLSLENDARGATASLKTEKGTDFDKRYVDTQVQEHQQVLDMIDQKLIPSAKDPGLKTLLADVRGTVAMHLQHAQALQNEMRK
ncbi:MAG: DUF4142 domain-containing protein [Polyangiaceae bacterium]